MSAKVLLLGARLAGPRLEGVVDRIEGDFAVVELSDGTFADVPLPLLPPEIGEGDRIRLRQRARRVQVRLLAPASTPNPSPRRPARQASPRNCAKDPGEEP